MLKRFIISFLLICIASVASFSQSVKMFTTPQALKNSIEKKYLDSGAYKYSYFSETEYYKSICMYKLHMKMEDVMKVYNSASADFQDGYSFTEDNFTYEKYPYQLSAYMVRSHNFFSRMP